MEEEIIRGYYCVIPAVVRYDNRLTKLAVLMYGEITALASETGVCWAGNKYFADLYNVSIRTISDAINKLKEYGYIDIDYQCKENSKEIEKRLIKITDEVVKISSRGYRKNFLGGIEKNFQDNNTSINNTSINTKEKKNIKKKRKVKEEEQVYTIGEFGNVKLSLQEIDKLITLYGSEKNLDIAIDILGNYIESSGHKYKSHYAVLRKNNWVYKKFKQEYKQ